MKILPKSIRWRLQLWYGLILLLVLAAFGFTADRLETSRQLRQIDKELQERIAVLLTAVLRPMPPRDPGDPRDARDLRELRESREFRESREPAGPSGPVPDGGRRRPGQGLAPGPGLGPPFGPRGEFKPGEPGRRLPRIEVRLAPEDAGLFDRGDVNPFYYVIWVRDGRVHSHSAKAPMPMPSPERIGMGVSPSVRTRGDFRESYLFAGPGDCILVGRSIAPDLAEMRRRTAWLLATGAGILALGLAGGWWLASRAIRPVEVISATAARISGGDLSQRISLSETESELGRLAVVLNSTFARLETAFAQQAQFTSDAAHELRTPVTVMLTQTQTALSRERAAEEYRETLEACQRAAQRMRRLIESLLVLARMDAGQEPLKRARLDVGAILRDCLDLVRPLAAERGIRLESDLPELPCEADAERLTRVFTNLLTNAIQYNRDGGSVRLAGRVAEGLVEIGVADTGVGISAEDLPHVFDRFYRADRARTGSGNAGLGLSISRAIIEAHGGTIECRSEPGRGATFTVRLPGAAPGARRQ